MNKTDQYLKQRMQNAAADVIPPKTGRYRLMQDVKNTESQAKRRKPRVLDLVEYEQIHGQGITYLALEYTMQTKMLGLLHLA
jgi:hypothetical protein